MELDRVEQKWNLFFFLHRSCVSPLKKKKAVLVDAMGTLFKFHWHLSFPWVPDYCPLWTRPVCWSWLHVPTLSHFLGVAHPEAFHTLGWHGHQQCHQSCSQPCGGGLLHKAWLQTVLVIPGVITPRMMKMGMSTLKEFEQLAPTMDSTAAWPQCTDVLSASLPPSPRPQVQVAEQYPAGAQLLQHGLFHLQGCLRAHHWGHWDRSTAALARMCQPHPPLPPPWPCFLAFHSVSCSCATL